MGFVETSPSPRLGFLRGVSLANHLPSNDNFTRTTKRQNTYQLLVAFYYDIWQGNEVGLLLQLEACIGRNSSQFLRGSTRNPVCLENLPAHHWCTDTP